MDAEQRQARREKLRKEAERRWQKLAREHPELETTIAFGRGLVARYIDDLPRAAPVTISVDEAREKLTAGVPLLEGLELDLDLPGIRRFFVGLCAWVREGSEASGQADEGSVGAGETEWIEESIRTGTLVVDDLVAASLAGEDGAIEAAAAEIEVSPVLLRTLTGFTVSAGLMETARALQPVLDEALRDGVEWLAGSCPVCGGAPLLAELQGSEGQRVLRCAACGAGWKYPRTRCAHCGNQDQRTLHYLATEEQAEKYRVDLCDRCHGYLKSVTSFEPTPAELLTIEDAAMLHLEATARERGYSNEVRMTNDE